jgi:heat shock protein HtpX
MPISHETRLAITLVLYFAGLALVVGIIGTSTGLGSATIYLALALAFIVLQNLGGPALIQRAMRVTWLPDDADLTRTAAGLADTASMPRPRVGVSAVEFANAFAFGRTKKDGRVCVTHRLHQILDEDELRAVLGHEVSHINHWDMTVTGLLAVVPTLTRMLIVHPLNDYSSGFWGWLLHVLVWMTTPLRFGARLALIPVNLIATVLMCYASRLCEMRADRGAVELGVQPEVLAAALYRISREQYDPDLAARAGGLRASLITKIGSGLGEYSSFPVLARDRGDRLDHDAFLRMRNYRISWYEVLSELFGSHPLLVRRLRQLARLTEISARGRAEALVSLIGAEPCLSCETQERTRPDDRAAEERAVHRRDAGRHLSSDRACRG